MNPARAAARNAKSRYDNRSREARSDKTSSQAVLIDEHYTCRNLNRATILALIERTELGPRHSDTTDWCAFPLRGEPLQRWWGSAQTDSGYWRTWAPYPNIVWRSNHTPDDARDKPEISAPPRSAVPLLLAAPPQPVALLPATCESSAKSNDDRARLIAAAQRIGAAA